MGGTALQDRVPRLQDEGVVGCQRLVVLQQVRAAIEVPPPVFVVLVSLDAVVRDEFCRFEFAPAEVHAAGVGHRVDFGDREVDPGVVDLGVLVEQSVDALEEVVSGRYIDGYGRASDIF